LELFADNENCRHCLAQRRNLGYDLGDDKLDRRELRDRADGRPDKRIPPAFTTRAGFPRTGENFLFESVVTH
jgi:hypothetical protein